MSEKRNEREEELRDKIELGRQAFRQLAQSNGALLACQNQLALLDAPELVHRLGKTLVQLLQLQQELADQISDHIGELFEDGETVSISEVDPSKAFSVNNVKSGPIHEP